MNTFSPASYTDRGWTFVHKNISRTNDGEGGAGTQGIHRCPAVPHAIFVCWSGHNVPESTVSACPLFLKQVGIHIIANPVTGVVLSMMFGQTHPLIIFVIEPVDLELIIRISGIQVSTKYKTSIVVVLFDVCIQIKIGNVGVRGIHDLPMKG